MTIEQELNMSYKDYVNHLLTKYGAAQYNYFANENCKSKNPKLSRVKEGLYVHHIDENRAILLSTPDVARLYPFEYQQADRLVYCNAIEHLLLHIKISQETKPGQDRLTFGIGGAEMIWLQINGWFERGYVGGWKKDAFTVIKDRYNDYIVIMKHLRNFIESDERLSQIFKKPALALNWQGYLMQKVHDDIYN